jgi:corrinoid protein of di/trimethylamine methyltransferase
MSQVEHADLAKAVVEGNAEEARRLARDWAESGGDPLEAVERGFAEGIRRVGELWEEGEYFLPELIQGAEAMKAALGALRPWLAKVKGKERSKGCVVIGTVQGDLHDIGKSLVATMLSAHGFEVHDLGSDVPVARFVEEARLRRADVVAASALLTTTMVAQRDLARAVRDARLEGSPRVLIGGAPTTPEWAAEIGALHAENALRAVAVAAATAP